MSCVNSLRFAVCLALGLVAQAACGQYVLLAGYKGKLWPVREARGRQPVVEVDGKRVLANGEQIALRPVDEFLPLFIAVRGMAGTDVSSPAAGSTFDFEADLLAGYDLEDVFLVLDLDLGNGNHTLYLHEVGRIDANVPALIRLVPPITRRLTGLRFELHLFVGGREVLHSGMPFATREGVLDRMIAKRNTGRVDANPKLFLGTPPEYPRKLEKTKTAGQVVVRVHVLPNGAVADPAVVKASAPEFGEAALEAVRQWRFLPKMKAGVPVAATVDVPLDFTPPAKS